MLIVGTALASLMVLDTIREFIMAKSHSTEPAFKEEAASDFLNAYLPLVKKIANHVLARLPACVLFEDLVQAGVIGLIEAYRNFDDTKGASFETYAGIRIKGSILDEIRKGDWSPRSVHRNARSIASVVKDVENKHGRAAKDSEVAEQLGVSLSEYHHMILDCSGVHVFSYDDFGLSGIDDLGDLLPQHRKFFNIPLEKVASTKFKESLSAKMEVLPKREALVLSLYYKNEMNLREIGDILEVSESRVSQMHAQAVSKLRGHMGEWR